MMSPSRKPSLTLWVGVGLILLTIGGLTVVDRLGRIETERTPLPVYSQVGDFLLTNQLGEAVSFANLRGKVWVADIIFSRCGGPCPEMSRNMSELQTALRGDDAVRLVSLTTDPGFDTPEVLARYGERFQADGDRWWFLTGARKEIFGLAVDGLKLTAIEKEPGERETPEDLFIHSTILVVVDSQGRLRAAIPGLEAGWKEKTLETIRALRSDNLE